MLKEGPGVMGSRSCLWLPRMPPEKRTWRCLSCLLSKLRLPWRSLALQCRRRGCRSAAPASPRSRCFLPPRAQLTATGLSSWRRPQRTRRRRPLSWRRLSAAPESRRWALMRLRYLLLLGALRSPPPPLLGTPRQPQCNAPPRITARTATSLPLRCPSRARPNPLRLLRARLSSSTRAARASNSLRCRRLRRCPRLPCRPVPPQAPRQTRSPFRR